MRAARTNDVAVMKVLLDGGADPFLRLPDRTNALLLAAGQGYGGTRGDGPRLPAPTEDTAIAAVTLLLDHGADIRYFNDAGNTVLHAAVARGDNLVSSWSSAGAGSPREQGRLDPARLASGGGGRRGGRGPFAKHRRAAETVGGDAVVHADRSRRTGPPLTLRPGGAPCLPGPPSTT